MAQSSINWLNIVSVVLLVIVLGVSYISYSNTNGLNELNDKINSVNNKVDNLNVPTADEIANQINVPTADEIASKIDTPKNIDADKLDRVCELTEGCEYYDINDAKADPVRNVVENKKKDFINAFSDLVEIDKDYLDIHSISLRDTQVRAYSKEDKEDKNFEVKLFYKVSYKDVDDTDYENEYIVVTSILDEGDYDYLDIESVARNFEFD